MQTWIIDLARELSMKTPNWIRTGLMAAFHAEDGDRGRFVEELHRKTFRKRLSLSRNSTNCGHGVRTARSQLKLCALRKPAH
jgi:hypothetical protein